MTLQRYWDADVFLGWLNREPEKAPLCDMIVDSANTGKCRLVTSTITFSEVFWFRGEIGEAAKIEAIKSLFDQSWIVPVALDRPTAELARELLFEFGKTEGLQPRDAMHLASAIRARVLGHVKCFDTWDRNLIHLGTQLHRVDALRGLKKGADLHVGPPTGQPSLLE